MNVHEFGTLANGVSDKSISFWNMVYVSNSFVGLRLSFWIYRELMQLYFCELRGKEFIICIFERILKGMYSKPR